MIADKNIEYELKTIYYKPDFRLNKKAYEQKFHAPSRRHHYGW